MGFGEGAAGLAEGGSTAAFGHSGRRGFRLVVFGLRGILAVQDELILGEVVQRRLRQLDLWVWRGDGLRQRLWGKLRQDTFISQRLRLLQLLNLQCILRLELLQPLLLSDKLGKVTLRTTGGGITPLQLTQLEGKGSTGYTHLS